jgi:hypothetical protein
MKFNLNNPLWEKNPTEARKAFETEIKEKIKQIERRLPLEERIGWAPGGVSYESVHLLGEMDILKEILGE